jgi:hypothetical protein
LLSGLAAWWWRRATDRGLLVLGLGCIFSSYLLVYSARAEWSYEQMLSWGRYQLIPQLGLTLFVCGGLRAAWPVDSQSPPIRRQLRVLGTALVVLLLFQAPRAIAQQWNRESAAQEATLRRIEVTDALCRQHAIDAATAKEALGRLEIPGSWSAKENGWDFLRGSDRPRPMTVEEARRVLFEAQHGAGIAPPSSG